MSDLDRFTAFLRRAAASYNEPPEVPAEAIWTGVEEGVADTAAASSGPTGGLGDAGAPAGAGPADDAPIIAPGYHAPPPPPRDEMWGRIETSLALRQAAASASDGPRAAPRRRPAWVGRRGTRGWVAALAAAASLVLGIALGRGARTAPPGEAPVATAARAPRAAQTEAVTPSVAAAELQPADTDNPIAPVAESASTGTAATTQPVDVPEGGEAGAPYLVAVNTSGELTAVPRDRYEPEHDYVTARHLRRAATLLTAFRTDRRTPASEQDLAQWARELLVDTRMFLGLSDFSSPIEQVLLEDLELVLIQIAGLGPGAPDFEWALARESMERRSTLMRLRAVSAEGEI
ncbi:MAG: hypothetical protein F4Y24_03975 [Gemmatimonadetes bacterium]|nr:hypothetical protein [Gemmatimonadota bacterium]MYG21020.1 hypothetical protein [Gemmatimonadota bacterium]MYJ37691.1 hypothetical protein [Gemmatimonadota bacterium]